MRSVRSVATAARALAGDQRAVASLPVARASRIIRSLTTALQLVALKLGDPLAVGGDTVARLEVGHEPSRAGGLAADVALKLGANCLGGQLEVVLLVGEALVDLGQGGRRLALSWASTFEVLARWLLASPMPALMAARASRRST